MSNFITTFEKGSREYEKLQITAVMMENRSAKHESYRVGNVCCDIGRNLIWTTIICWNNGSPYQALTKDEREQILKSETFEEMSDVVNGIFNK